MKMITFYAGEDDVGRIQAEQERLGNEGAGASESDAIRSLMSRAVAAPVNGARNGVQNGAKYGAEAPKFRVMRSGKILHQRVEKFFIE